MNEIHQVKAQMDFQLLAARCLLKGNIQWSRKGTGIYFHTVLEVRNLKPQGQQDHTPSKPAGKKPSLLAPTFWQFSGNCWHSEACSATLNLCLCHNMVLPRVSLSLYGIFLFL